MANNRLVGGNPAADERGWARLLWWWVLDEVDALIDITLKAFRASLEELLFLVGHALQNVASLLCAIGLFDSVSLPWYERRFCEVLNLTPRVTRVEKNSTPVAWTISSPPGIPGR